MSSTYDHLKAMLEEAAEGLPLVVAKKMFGCDALFRDRQIFGLVWKEDRLGVRLPDEAAFREAMKLDGAAPWAPMGGAKGMAHWVLLPETFHDEPEELAAWVKRAHDLAGAPAAAKKKPAATKKAKKPAPAKKKPAKKR